MRIKREKAVAAILAVLTAGMLLAGCTEQPTPSTEPTKSSAPTSLSEEQKPTESESHPQSEEEQSPTDSGQSKEPLVYIGCGTAQRLAVAHLGFAPEQVQDLWSTMQKKQGVVVHEVTFEKDGVSYLLDVDAKSGEVLQVVKTDKQ